MTTEPLFVHIPKTAGASLREVCRTRNIPVLEHNLNDPAFVPLHQYLASHPDCKPFAILRNPWDRLVSAYQFLRAGGITPGDRKDAEQYVDPFNNFTDFVMGGVASGEALAQIHLKPQAFWISHEGTHLVNDLARFENLQADVSSWLTRSNKPDALLGWLNKSSRGHYRGYYRPETKAVVAEVYAEDIALMDYQF